MVTESRHGMPDVPDDTAFPAVNATPHALLYARSDAYLGAKQRQVFLEFRKFLLAAADGYWYTET